LCRSHHENFKYGTIFELRVIADTIHKPPSTVEDAMTTITNLPADSKGEFQNDLRLSLQVLLVLGTFVMLALMVAFSINALPGLLS
jgi:hypothetical protein